MSTSDNEGTGSFVTCPTCERRLPPAAKYCGFDGTAVGGAPPKRESGDIRRPTQLDADQKQCPVCHKRYPGYALFCSSDGGRLNDVTALAAAQSQSGAQFQLVALDKERRLPAADLIGRTIDGKYRVDEFLGEGGMAIVYRATNIAIEKPVVLKVLQGRLLSDERSVKRFERECKVTAKISHPNVVSVFDVGYINNNQPFLVMEFIKGESLRDKIERERRLGLAMAVSILIQVCRGLQEAHNLGVIHRDLKPENVLLLESADRPDWVKIVDFGIAQILAGGTQRLTRTGNVVGTAEYLAPEQLRDQPLDHRVDIYALGVMLFEMLTGKVPFEADTTEGMLLKVILDPPESVSFYRSDIPAGSPVDALIKRSLEKDPGKRFLSAQEMRQELEGIYASMPA